MMSLMWMLIGFTSSMYEERTVPHGQAGAASAQFEVRIDLNRAGEAKLHLLPTIGPRLAERIVEHREEHGPFASLEDLLHVRGVGGVTIERIAPFVTVEP